ncbi:LuxR C-terminal-related transcriptional regulator [Croceicoccus mobilis]|uniref:HTH luxR-type domain-containing protein n=1 Tax=Croceicoccus mobilis TaxID=1703339 RepID=A0A917DVT5_9SPHN|nr:LuxR C-terminal-related transcriptional regulator [Croceicoccus mobilis]GGD75984.1 hypothetical protein GCM10010990_27020 [Croceicoccus mobilis]
MDIIDQIYDALDDDAVFANLPDVICREIGARSCTLQIFAPDGAIIHQAINYFPEEMGRYYLEHGFDKMDAWADVMTPVSLSTGRACRASDMMKPQEFMDSRMFNDFLRAFGDDSLWCVGTMGKLRDGSLFLIGSHRGKDDADFDDEAIARIDRLAPHYRRMINARSRLIEAEQSAAIAQSGLHAVGVAMLLLDHCGRICFMNETAASFAKSGFLFTATGGRIGFPAPGVHSAWERTLRSATTRTGMRGGSFLADDMNGERWHVHLQPRLVEGRSLTMAIMERGAIAQDAGVMLAEMYELTDAEVRVAVAVAKGMSAKHIAQELDVREPTVRTHTAHIYAKMNINKASDLVRLIAGLPLLRR